MRIYVGRIIGILLFTTFVMTPSVWANHGKSQCKYQSKWSLEDKFFKKAHFIFANREELGLSDEQVTQLRTLKINTKKALIKQKAEIEVLKIDIKSNLYNNPINVEATHALVDKKYTIKAAKAKGLVSAVSELKKTLSKEQWDKLKSLWKAQK